MNIIVDDTDQGKMNTHENIFHFETRNWVNFIPAFIVKDL